MRRERNEVLKSEPRGTVVSLTAGEQTRLLGFPSTQTQPTPDFGGQETGKMLNWKLLGILVLCLFCRR
ncbi:hypothetical protein J1605_020108 [Eschrichtius robustus]|uniref:Uncharacterized protein n=1 Tax=Eschrichtius robustus TaxID=9764 RepID=A0AB34HNE6_ESCRO|nr:hypothetical protein J1605_020108 [Eschrichtius robustus]